MSGVGCFLPSTMWRSHKATRNCWEGLRQVRAASFGTISEVDSHFSGIFSTTASEPGGHATPVVVATLILHVVAARRPNTQCQLILRDFSSQLGSHATSLSPNILLRIRGWCACTQVTLLFLCIATILPRLARALCLSFTHHRYKVSSVVL